MSLFQRVTFSSFVFMFATQSHVCAGATKTARQPRSQEAAQQKNADALLAASAAGDDQVVANLLLDGTNPNCIDSNGDSPLTLAGLNGHAAVAEWLLMAGADQKQTNYAHFTAADLALQNGNLAFVQLFIDKQLIALNTQNTYGFTPLMIAAQYGHDAIVHVLAEAGADVNAESMYQHPVIILAIARGHCQTVRLLHSLGATLPPLPRAKRYLQENKPAMRNLLQELCK